MPDFIVTTVHDRNIILKADKFVDDGCAYQFLTNGLIVASVPKSPEILAVAEYDEAFQADFYTYDDPTDEDDEDDDETDDVCLDCRFSEFLESQEFANTVLDYIQVWFDNNFGEDPDFVPDAPPSEDKAEPTVQYRQQKSTGSKYYGFVWPGHGFVHFSAKEYDENGAEYGLKMFKDGFRNWYTIPLSDTEIIEEVDGE